MNSAPTALLLATHRIDEGILSLYYKLYEEAENEADVWLLLETEDGNMPHLPEEVHCYPFSVDTLNELGFEPIAETIVPGSNHFPLWQFRHDHPEYAYYWSIEYDVRFSGHWNKFLRFFRDKKEDFISSHIQTLEENPYWPHWRRMHTAGIFIRQTEYLKSFNPIYRISARAMDSVEQFLLSGASGHHELLLPTWLHHQGFSLRDMGGTGSFVYPEKENLFYTDCDAHDSWYQASSMRYRPLYTVEDMNIANKLYHPIKN